MEQGCSKTNQNWDYVSNTLSTVEQKDFQDHLSGCPSCSLLHTMVADWKNDKATDNPYIAQKVLALISSGDILYAHTGKLVIRWAFLVAIIVGISLGVLVQNGSNSPAPKLQIAENEYQQAIDAYSTEIHYYEMRTDETQLLLTDAR